MVIARGIAVLAILVTGCASQLDLSVPASSSEEFQYCMAHARGMCTAPHAARALPALLPIARAGTPGAWVDRSGQPHEAAVSRALAARAQMRASMNRRFDEFANHPVTSSIVELHDRLGTAGADPSPLTFRASDVRQFVALAGALSQGGGWAIAGEDAKDNDEGRARKVYAAFLEVYLKAYFRNGEFGSIKFGEKEGFGKVGQGAFVSRVGRQLQFPPLEVTVDPTQHTAVSVAKIEYADVGADLVRVILEALFDAHDRFPAVENATGADASRFLAAEVKAGYPLLVHVPPEKGEPGKVTAEQFTRAAEYANKVEGFAAASTGQLVRGGSFLSLNNEAVAKAIEALAGTTARKATEKAMYCWYACVVNEERGAAKADLETTAPGDTLSTATIRFR